MVCQIDSSLGGIIWTQAPPIAGPISPAAGRPIKGKYSHVDGKGHGPEDHFKKSGTAPRPKSLDSPALVWEHGKRSLLNSDKTEAPTPYKAGPALCAKVISWHTKLQHPQSVPSNSYLIKPKFGEVLRGKGNMLRGKHGGTIHWKETQKRKLRQRRHSGSTQPNPSPTNHTWFVLQPASVVS